MDMIKNIFGKKDDTSQDTSALEQAEASGDIIVSPDVRRDNRIPPGQSRTVKWPVLHAGGVPPSIPRRGIFA